MQFPTSNFHIHLAQKKNPWWHHSPLLYIIILLTSSTWHYVLLHYILAKTWNSNEVIVQVDLVTCCQWQIHIACSKIWRKVCHTRSRNRQTRVYEFGYLGTWIVSEWPLLQGHTSYISFVRVTKLVEKLCRSWPELPLVPCPFAGKWAGNARLVGMNSLHTQIQCVQVCSEYWLCDHEYIWLQCQL